MVSSYSSRFICFPRSKRKKKYKNLGIISSPNLCSVGIGDGIIVDGDWKERVKIPGISDDLAVTSENFTETSKPFAKTPETPQKLTQGAGKFTGSLENLEISDKLIDTSGKGTVTVDLVPCSKQVTGKATDCDVITAKKEEIDDLITFQTYEVSSESLITIVDDAIKLSDPNNSPVTATVYTTEPTNTAVSTTEPTNTAVSTTEPTNTAISTTEPTNTAVSTTESTNTAVSTTEPTNTAVSTTEPTNTAASQLEPVVEGKELKTSVSNQTAVSCISKFNDKTYTFVRINSADQVF